MQNAHPSDEGDLSREVNQVNKALNSIFAETADRRKILEDVEQLAKDYHSALQALGEVLNKVEHRLRIQRAFGAEPDRITEELEEVKVITTSV